MLQKLIDLGMTVIEPDTEGVFREKAIEGLMNWFDEDQLAVLQCNPGDVNESGRAAGALYPAAPPMPICGRVVRIVYEVYLQNSWRRQ